MRLFQKKEGAPAKGLPRRILPLALAAAVLAAGGFGAVRLLGGVGGGEQIVTDLVTRDTIQSTVKGSGAASARESVSLNPPVSATVLALHVKEGDRVEKGTVLYELDPAEAQKATEEAKKSLTEAEKGVTAAAERLQAAQKQLSETEEEYQKLLASKADLTVTAPFDGKLVEAASLLPDAEITAGQKLATLVSSNRLKLSLYYSYAYLDQLRVGQEAAVSIPAVMASVPGKISEINKVEFVTPEGSKCFEVVVALDNPGTLTEGMAASAGLTVGGQAVYPYQNGKLAYQETREVTAKVPGPLKTSFLHNHAPVKKGQAILVLGPDELDKQLEEKRESVTSARESVDSARTAVESAQETLTSARDKVKKALEQEADMAVKAPITGTVLTCLLEQGEKADSGQLGILLADTSVMRIDIQVDERNVSRVKTGMTCTITQTGLGGEENTFEGTVESVSLTGKSENGVSFFPAVVKVDNGDGAMLNGMSIEYELVLAQSEDCLVVPAQAVQYTEQGSCLFVKADRRPDNAVDLGDGVEIPRGFYAVPVETGLSNSAQVEIKSGVEEGMEVFTQKLVESGSSFDMM
ncbi:HlyD family efflux transporter periplasmic adaptor subunit [uncultured Flavonifractor sp.]|uniref:HlyD family efflux transporter periplasmic adaptor subunit n=1 Tax=uncultured Flavonifractor sp. TaxID=1193534 RepID=UPI00174E5BF0|nr:HlyD family efflux transporter periplasmic adaptor subunit [uncultured Flavonifractor sp.]